jgi:hypothetical protein
MNPGSKPVKANIVGNYVAPGKTIVVSDDDVVMMKAVLKGLLIIVEEAPKTEPQVEEPAPEPDDTEIAVVEEETEPVESQPVNTGGNRQSTKKKTSTWSEES